MTAGPLRFDLLHGAVQLVGTVAPDAAKDVPGQALGMDPHQHRLVAADVNLDQRQMFKLVDVVFEGDGAETAVLARQRRLDGAPYQAFVLQAVGDQVRYCADLDTMLLGEFLQLGHYSTSIQMLSFYASIFCMASGG